MGKTRAHTVRISLTNLSQLLTAAIDTALGLSVDYDGIVAAMITAETYDCRIAFGCEASTTIGHILAAGQAVRIPSADMIQTAQIINKTAGETSVIQVTLEY